MNDTEIIHPGYGYHYWTDPPVPSKYEWCHYKVSIESLSSGSVDWHVTNEEGYRGFNDFRPFGYFYGEAGVRSGTYEFDVQNGNRFYVTLRNNNQGTSIQIRTQIIETCYKS